MFLSASLSIGSVLSFGVSPAIDFLNMAEDAREAGNSEKADSLVFEAKSKLFEIRERLTIIDEAVQLYCDCDAVKAHVRAVGVAGRKAMSDERIRLKKEGVAQ